MPKPEDLLDVVIIGGGLVGMAAALKLAEVGMSVVLLEAKLPDMSMQHDSYDSRTLVVNPASRKFWQQLGVWQTVEETSTAINQVHVSNKGQFGSVLFDHQELGVSALGHVVEATVLGAVLWDKVKAKSNIYLMTPATLLDFSVTESNVEISIEHQGTPKQLKAKLMIAADGAQSSIRAKLKLPFETKAYDKSALICNISTTKPHNNRAYERLTKSGPFALLPFHDRYGLVWSNSHEKTDELMHLTESQFMEKAQKEFGFRQGQFIQIGQRHRYPLYKIKVEKQYQSRIVLIGNAAHTVSPVSAQGLNLAIRGVSRLCQLLHEVYHQGGDLGAEPLLLKYQNNSQADQDQILSYTDDLMTWFKIDEPIINRLRSLSLVAIDSQIGLKKRLFRLAAGLNH